MGSIENEAPHDWVVLTLLGHYNNTTSIRRYSNEDSYCASALLDAAHTINRRGIIWRPTSDDDMGDLIRLRYAMGLLGYVFYQKHRFISSAPI